MKLWLLAAVLTLVVGVSDYLGDQGIVPIGTVHYLSYTVSLVLVALRPDAAEPRVRAR